MKQPYTGQNQLQVSLSSQLLMQILVEEQNQNFINVPQKKIEIKEDLPEPTARMPDWGGLMMAQNCLMPKGPPKFDTVKVPPYKGDAFKN